MMNNARRLLLAGLGAFAVLLSGCATPAIERSHSYTEQVSSVLISADKQKIVFIGNTSHYIFDAPNDLVRALELPLHHKINGTLSNFNVDGKGVVTGWYSLQLDSGASERDRGDATAGGFKPNVAGKLVLPGKLSGTRYRRSDTEANMTAQKLNKTYAVELSYEPSAGDKVAEALITPIIVTNEGLFFIYNIVLAPVLVPMGFSKINTDCVPYCMRDHK